MQNRVCKYLRHPQEAFSVGLGIGAREERMDPLEIDLCTWLTSKVGGYLPPALNRRAGGGVDLQDGDCDLCQCFEPIDIAIPHRVSDQARSSTVEPSPHERGVAGSNPAGPTNIPISDYKRDDRQQKGTWAPGDYLCKCVHCGCGFIGDKRAVSCADCAYAEADAQHKELPDPLPDGVEGLITKVEDKAKEHWGRQTYDAAPVLDEAAATLRRQQDEIVRQQAEIERLRLSKVARGNYDLNAKQVARAALQPRGSEG